MKNLYVHDRFGALSGAEVNPHITATELGLRGHTRRISHGPATGMDEVAWDTSYRKRFPLHCKNNASVARNSVRDFRPDVTYERNIAMERPCSLFGRLRERQRAGAKSGAHASSGSRGPTQRMAQTLPVLS